MPHHHHHNNQGCGSLIIFTVFYPLMFDEEDNSYKKKYVSYFSKGIENNKKLQDRADTVTKCIVECAWLTTIGMASYETNLLEKMNDCYYKSVRGYNGKQGYKLECNETLQQRPESIEQENIVISYWCLCFGLMAVDVLYSTYKYCKESGRNELELPIAKFLYNLVYTMIYPIAYACELVEERCFGVNTHVDNHNISVVDELDSTINAMNTIANYNSVQVVGEQ